MAGNGRAGGPMTVTAEGDRASRELPWAALTKYCTQKCSAFWRLEVQGHGVGRAMLPSKILGAFRVLPRLLEHSLACGSVTSLYARLSLLVFNLPVSSPPPPKDLI